MSSDKFSIWIRIKSFSFAVRGILDLFKREHNARVHLAAAIIVTVVGFVLKIERVEWIFIVFAIGLVIFAELFNTAIERLADKVEPDQDDLIRQVKDYAAGAVLISTVISIVVAGLIFLPKILDW